MHHKFPCIYQLLTSAAIALSALLTSGCGTYYEQPVTYVPQVPCYAPTYSYPSYPVYQPVVVPIPSPRYAWNAPYPTPCSWHRGDDSNEEYSWQKRKPAVEHSHEEHRSSSWGQRQQYAARSKPDRNSQPQSYQSSRSAAPPRQAPPPPVPVTTFQQQPSLANNQDPSTR